MIVDQFALYYIWREMFWGYDSGLKNLQIYTMGVSPRITEPDVNTPMQWGCMVRDADTALGIEREIIGIKCRIAIYNLYNLRIDLRLVCVSIVLGSISIDICRTSVNQDIAKTLNMTFRVTHRTICRYHRTIMVSSEITNNDHNLLAIIHHLPTLVRLHLNIVALRCTTRDRGLLFSLLRLLYGNIRQAIASRKDQTRQRHEQNRYGNNSSLHAYLLYFTQFLFEKSPPRNSGAM